MDQKYSEQEIEAVLKQYGLIYERYDEIEAVTARLLIQGQIISWFQGRMELGPRFWATGSRWQTHAMKKLSH
ncbi:MAG: hypothetical protein R3E08_05110 [Thiotrichaceae bacterium]